MTAQLDQVIRNGCRVWRVNDNFNHSKLITIDGAWSYVGSSNLDPRSLRLNFELDMEIYSRDTARELETLIDSEIAKANSVAFCMGWQKSHFANACATGSFGWPALTCKYEPHSGPYYIQLLLRYACIFDHTAPAHDFTIDELAEIGPGKIRGGAAIAGPPTL